jgi:hypothetical protein
VPPSASSQGGRAPGQGERTTHQRRLSPHTDTAPALSADTRYPHTAGRWRTGVCQPSQHDSDLPTEPVTLIDLRCTPEVPGIHLPWTCAATGRAPATTPTHPILPMSGLDVAVV